jgi:opacity protein-like surface antigen
MKRILSALLICLTFSSYGLAVYNFRNVYIGLGASRSSIDTSIKSNVLSLQYEAFMGYRFTDNLRWDLQYIFITKAIMNDTFDYRANVMLTNIYFDFWNMENRIITPFLGIGAGLGSPHIISGDLMWNKNGFAWQALGGFHMKVNDFLILSVKYSYIELPPVSNILSEKDLTNIVHSIGIDISLLV